MVHGWSTASLSRFFASRKGSHASLATTTDNTWAVPQGAYGPSAMDFRASGTRMDFPRQRAPRRLWTAPQGANGQRSGGQRSVSTIDYGPWTMDSRRPLT